ncbi:hypothetical protein [Nonomuraea zeae]|uniref:Uncharacterized protein n=1 Tax=Nonomuraea zeae TaxID=1642303 RepID=A0A5S4GYK2_9ACTN|nr:hypothetical protein [Nonomuraea zeae]TMR37879.1 hypothetical protein ETD85_06525 [Nonomuraea zeae]
MSTRVRQASRALLNHDRQAGERELSASARRLRQACRGAEERPFGHDPRASRGNLDNDRFFGVVRVAGDPYTVLLGATAQAYAELLDELGHAGTTLDEPTLGELGLGLAALIAAATGETPAALPMPRRPADPAAATDQPLRRWRRGHHLFMVLLQALAITAGGLTATIRSAAASGEEARERLRAQWALLTTLLRGSSAALRFTGDFAGIDYITRVRPLMSDPTVPGGMTGLELRDHRFLVRRLRELGAALKSDAAAGEVCAHGSAAFQTVLAEVYAAHGEVCAHFVGADRTSLIAAGGPPAVAVLERLAAARLQLFPEPLPTSTPI